MAVPIAELFISVSADVSQAVTNLNALNGQLNRTTNAFQQAAPAAAVLAGAGAAVAAGFLGAVRVAADFDKAMSGVRAVMAPGEVAQFGSALDDLALSLGAKTSFNAMQSAAAIEELIKQGIPAKDVLGGAADAVLALAAATGSTPAEAATVAAQAMNAFKASVADLPDIVDRLAGVSNATAADMGGLRLGLQQVGAVAHLAGFSFEDTITALGAMANAGVVGSDAGTSLKTMFLNLVPSTKQQTAAFQRLGIITASGANQFFDATGKVKNMAGVAGVLETALAGMTHEQKLATAQTLFGTDAMRAAAILAELGAKGFSDLSGEVKKISAADQAAERLNNLLGNLEQLGGALQTAQITIGRFFTPALRSITQAVTEVINGFNNMSPEAKKVATAIVGIVGAVAGGVGGLVLLAGAARFLAPSFLAVGRVLLTLVPVFRIAALLAGALAFAWSSNLFGLRDLVRNAFDKIPQVLETVSAVFSRAGDFWERSVVPALLTIANEIERRVIPVFNALADSPVGQAVAHLFDAIGIVFNAIVTGNGQQVLDFFGSLLPDSFKAFASGAGENIGHAFDFISRVFDAIISGHGQEVIDFFKDRLPQPLKDLGKAIEGPVGNAFESLGIIFNALRLGQGGLLIELFKSQLPEAFKSLGAALEGPVGNAFQALGSIAAALVSGNGQLVIDFFKANLPDALKEAGRKLEGLGPIFTAVGGFFGGLAAVLLNLNSEKLQSFSDTFGGTFADSFSKFGNQLSPLVPVFASIGAFAASLNNLILTFQGLKASGAGGAEAGDALVSPLQRLADFVAKNTNLGDITTFLGPIGQAFRLFRDNAEGIAEFIDTLTKALDAFALTIKTMPDPPPWLLAFIQKGPAAGALDVGGVVAGPVTQPPGPPNPFDQTVNDLFGGSNAFDNLFKHTAFTPGGQGGGGGGPLVSIGQLIISSEAEAQAFLQQMAEAVRAAAGRVSPPVPAGQPGVVTGIL